MGALNYDVLVFSRLEHQILSYNIINYSGIVMTTTRLPSPIKPKISTMPRKQSEASQQLELYKLITEKQRIQKELKLMEQRFQQLNNRLTVLNHQIESTEQSIQDLRQVNPSLPKINPSLPKMLHPSKPAAPSSNNFQAFYLEY
jgi:hypothetical protein